MAKTALILGAGIGGIVAAQTLRKLLPPEHRVVVVERQHEHVFAPSLLWYMTGGHEAARFTRPLSTLSAKGIELVHGDITGIDPAALSVEVGGQSLRGDAMVLALGADYAPELIPGLAEVGHNLYTLIGATAIQRALENFQGGRIVVLTAAPAYKCPAAPYEAAMLVDAYCKKRQLHGPTEVVVYAAEPIPMAVTGPAIGEQVKMLLDSKGIGYFPNHQVNKVETGLLHFSDGSTTPFDLLLYVPPHRVPAVVKAAGLCAESGWVAVDRGTLQTKFPEVYAIGDVTSIPLKMGRPLPKAGVFAHGQAEVVAHNLAHAWTGQGAPRLFTGEGMCFLEIGDARAGLGKGNFYAEPTPQVAMHGPNVLWHAGKVLYEKYWLYRYF
ncbi:NAD(P)/FAD-dependent oxidoreductase [Rhodoferax sp.]|uniref:NAD(P)/FAD-dependent oxidoreductase n=1 Tax=Rhodoferax sp. TaxID=50421 RepID=UPI00276EE9C1|nr:FAD/NAD(P)-binding oxidoreductase [Rhodoferax sp.]